MFLAALDDHSKACAIVPLKSKSAAFKQVKLTVAKFERQLGTKTQIIRSDGGTEFGSGEAKRWYAELGIQHQITTAYTPELNGTAERFIRTAKDMIKATLMDSGLGHEYWDHAARYAARSPHSSSSLSRAGIGVPRSLMGRLAHGPQSITSFTSELGLPRSRRHRSPLARFDQ